ncbi:hypothetical protein QJS10_CPB11g00714 [Acorus calamus]|uniref:CCHC-type domain-containing protein n=1 Tax=Acorus calamus TaxID=4465 RepID=A0AAV9DQF4_ACOCL|nr:hypothetical protein QJS10_CPB11g00714 [Acorus calamus]
MFPELFEIAMNRTGLVKDFWVSTSSRGGWHLRLRRRLNDDELLSYSQLFGTLANQSIDETGVDSPVWTPSPSTGLTVKKAYNWVRGGRPFNAAMASSEGDIQVKNKPIIQVKKFTKELSEKKAEDSLSQSKTQKVLSDKKDEDSLANPKVMELEMDESVTRLEPRGAEAEVTSPLLGVVQEADVEVEEYAASMKKVKGVASLFPADPCDRSVGTSAGELKDMEEVGWQLVRGQRRNRGVPRRPSSGASHPSDDFILPRLVKCFRCLGRGHYARDYRDPPRCWTCKKMGHRSFVCKSCTRGPSPLGGPARLSCRLSPLTPTYRVEVEWSPKILDRIRSMGKSVFASWDGGQEMLPSWAALEVILLEKKLATEEGDISFSEPDFTDIGAGGFQMQVLLHGLPMVWRTEGCLRKVVEPFRSRLNYIEILDCEEILPPAKVTIWVSKEGRPPLSMLVVLGGLEVKVQVEVLPSHSSNAYAYKVRFGHGQSLIGGAREVGGSRQPEVAPKGPPMAMDDGGEEGRSGDGPTVQQSSPVPKKVDDVIFSGNPDFQTSIHEASSVLPTGALLVGHVIGGSLKRKELMAELPKASQGDSREVDGVHILKTISVKIYGKNFVSSRETGIIRGVSWVTLMSPDSPKIETELGGSLGPWLDSLNGLQMKPLLMSH